MSAEKFKKNLLEGEENFDPKAWDELAKKLDQVMPVAKKSLFTKSNILITSTFVSLAVLGIYIISSDKKENNETKITNNTILEEENESKDLISEDLHEKSISKKVISGTEINSKSNKIENLNEFETELVSRGSEVVNQENKNLVENYSEKKQEYKSVEFKLPKFKENYCLLEEVEIKNENPIQIYLLNENEEILSEIPAGKSKNVKLKKKGIHYLKYTLNDIKSTEKIFIVNQGKELDFTIENEVIYENGLPYIQLVAKNFNSSYKWSSDKGLFTSDEDKTKLRVLEKGKYSVRLEDLDKNACSSSKTESIFIEEDYNLLAPTAFIPTDIDPRNNRFMPLALTKRAVQFELIIIDPKINRVVFKSNSAENAWDGTDMNSGEQVQSNKSFIWKVSLKNPEINEKSEYIGTIVRM
jgi:hypothetical protein